MCRIRAKPVCRIKWIRRHGTLSSYRLRRKLHGPFSYAAGYGKLRPGAVSTRQDMAMPDERFPRTKQKLRNKVSVACNAIMSIQYVILYYIAGPICRGPNGYVHSSLEI